MIDGDNVSAPDSGDVLISRRAKSPTLDFPVLAAYRDCLICYRSLREVTLSTPEAVASNYEKGALMIDSKGRAYGVLNAIPSKTSLLNTLFGFLHVFVIVDLVLEDLTMKRDLETLKDLVIASAKVDAVILEDESLDEEIASVNSCKSAAEIVRACCG